MSGIAVTYLHLHCQPFHIVSAYEKNRQGTLIKRATMGRMVRIQLDMLGVSGLLRRLLTAPTLSSIVINRAAIASQAEQKEDYVEDEV